MDEAIVMERIVTEAYRLNKSLRETYRMCIKAGIFWYRFNFVVNLAIIVLGFIASKEGIMSKNSEMAGILAFIAGVIKTFASSLNPAKRAEECKNAANSYGVLEDKIRIFRTIDIESMNVAQAGDALTSMIGEKNDLNKTLSSVTYRNIAQFDYNAVDDLDGDDCLDLSASNK
ncbi:hypothetical protein CAXC1_120024 [Candidatus Xenohaliotis californiensis]|uniref:SMODS and SLOG-associating 2TM effector domain-containing protein n=1 Tax=Candidatus Xenohaliotis californiensis TaxID=84677 RepID=A0ABM9N6Y7_9RICK|nr:hypothetical protein CAXC1_120024 [Candidatus Xenohaliotis californiensis]